MSQIFDTNVEPSTAGYKLGTSLRYWDAYLGNVLEMQTYIMQGIAAPGLSAAGAGKIYFDSTSNKFQASQNGGAYVDLVGTFPPFIDTQTIIKGSADATKLLKIEVDGLTTATTRTWTAADVDLTVAGINVAQTWSAAQTHSANILASGTPNIGATTLAFANGYFTTVFGQAVKIANAGSSFATFWNLTLASASQLDVQDNAAAVVWSFTTTNHSSGKTIIPSLNNTYSLGSSSFAWNKVWTKDLNVTGVVSSHLIASGAVDVGSTAAPFTHLYATNVHGETVQIALNATSFGTFWTMDLGGAGVFRLKDNAATILFQISTTSGNYSTWTTHHIPSVTDTYDLGTTTYRWAYLWSHLVNVGIGAGTGGYIDFEGTSPAPGLSASGKCRMYFDSGTNKLRISQNAAAYVDVV